MTVGVLRHPVERLAISSRRPPSRFYLVHLPGELLLDALPQGGHGPHRESHTPGKSMPSPGREHPLVPLHFQETGTLPMRPWTASRIFHSSAFVLPSTTSVIAIAVEMTHPVPVLQIVVQKHRQIQQIAQPLASCAGR